MEFRIFIQAFMLLKLLRPLWENPFHVFSRSLLFSFTFSSHWHFLEIIKHGENCNAPYVSGKFLSMKQQVLQARQRSMCPDHHSQGSTNLGGSDRTGNNCFKAAQSVSLKRGRNVTILSGQAPLFVQRKLTKQTLKIQMQRQVSTWRKLRTVNLIASVLDGLVIEIFFVQLNQVYISVGFCF